LPNLKRIERTRRWRESLRVKYAHQSAATPSSAPADVAAPAATATAVPAATAAAIASAATAVAPADGRGVTTVSTPVQMRVKKRRIASQVGSP
jgi:hypothetical protein